MLLVKFPYGEVLDDRNVVDGLFGIIYFCSCTVIADPNPSRERPYTSSIQYPGPTFRASMYRPHESCMDCSVCRLVVSMVKSRSNSISRQDPDHWQ